MILDKIAAGKKRYLENQKRQMPLTEIQNKLAARPTEAKRSFFKALANPNEMAVIAEIKKASPSKGLLSAAFDPLQTARQYFAAPVDAISVLTETDFFLGSPDHLAAISRESKKPLLRKDFIIDEYQIYESKLLGADAILLIAALLDEKTLKRFCRTAQSLGLDCLLEAHNEAELRTIEAAGGRIVGINNRDLQTFREDIETTLRLLPLVSKDKLVVSESAVHTPEEIRTLQDAGVSAVLIGEAFMKSTDIQKTAATLKGMEQGGQIT